jgi:hypothetical protein
MSHRKNPIIEYDGDVFYANVHNYFVSAKTGRQLHRVVWANHNCEIPVGYVIHHIDLNRSNNDIKNLRLMSARDHAKLHYELSSGFREFRHRRKICQVDGCENFVKGRGLCSKHYQLLMTAAKAIEFNRRRYKRSDKTEMLLRDLAAIYLKNDSRFRDGFSFVEAVRSLI